jgi:hypothetical protein
MNLTVAKIIKILLCDHLNLYYFFLFTSLSFSEKLSFSLPFPMILPKMIILKNPSKFFILLSINSYRRRMKNLT